jgi:protease IV
MQAQKLHLVDRVGGLREALAEARRLARLPNDAPIISMPQEPTSLLGTLLGLAGIAGADAGEPTTPIVIPPALLEAARALTPLLVFDASKPLARMELIGEDDVFPTSKPNGVQNDGARPGAVER